MNIDNKTLHELVSDVTNTQGTNNKVALLSEYLKREDFRLLIKYTYDPNINFFTKHIKWSKLADKDFDQNIIIQIYETLVINGVRGNKAIDFLKSIGEQLNAESQRLMLLFLKRDLKLGANISLINKAAGSELIFDSSKHYMRCSLPDEKTLSKFDWNNSIVQLKLDGAYFEFSSRGFRSRSGKYIDTSILNLEYEKPFIGILMGELVIYNVLDNTELRREESNGLLNSLVQGTPLPDGYYLQYHVWDWKSIETEYSYTCCIPYSERYIKAKEMISFLKSKTSSLTKVIVSIVENIVVNSVEEAYKVANDFMAAGKEGAVLKDLSSYWLSGTSKQQVKLKAELDADLEIVELVPGDPLGKHKDTFGSILCKTSDDKLFVKISGFTDSERLFIYNNFQDLVGKIVTVTFNSIVKNNDIYSLFLPRVSKDSNGNMLIREDKTVADTLDRLLEVKV